MQGFIKIVQSICSMQANNLSRLLGILGVQKHPQSTPLRLHLGSWGPHQLKIVTNGAAMQAFIKIVQSICSTQANNLLRLLGILEVQKHPQSTPIRPHIGSWGPHQLQRVANGTVMQSFIKIAQSICSMRANNLPRLLGVSGVKKHP